MVEPPGVVCLDRDTPLYMRAKTQFLVLREKSLFNNIPIELNFHLFVVYCLFFLFFLNNLLMHRFYCCKQEKFSV